MFCTNTKPKSVAYKTFFFLIFFEEIKFLIQITNNEAKKLRAMCKKIHIRNTKNKYYLDECSKSIYLLSVVRGLTTNATGGGKNGRKKT